MNESKEIKMLQAMVDVTNYLADHKFTYPEAEKFVQDLQNEISCSKDAEEYKTADDWYHKRPCCNIREKILVPLNNVNVKEVFGLM